MTESQQSLGVVIYTDTTGRETWEITAPLLNTQTKEA